MVIQFLIALVVFTIIDLIWLGFLGRPLYQKYIGHLLKKDVNWTAAILFYFMFIGMLYYFVIQGLSDDNLLVTVINGGLFGFAMYATYDLTNLATLEGWSLEITIIDLIWGTFLGSLTTLLSGLIILGLGV
jgi:uncharacterized membrane protein